MNLRNKSRIVILFLGDLIALYAALFITLFLRYGGGFYAEFLNSHFLPFSMIFVLWLLVFYVTGLYDPRHLRNNLDFLKMLAAALAINFTLAVFFFYLIPAFGITPKTNLFIFLVMFAVLEIFWRRIFNKIAVSGEAPNKVLLIAQSAVNPISEILLKDPSWLKQLGYEIVAQLPETDIASAAEKLPRIVGEKKINFIAVPRRLRNDEKLTRKLYELLASGVEIHDLPTFYENVTRKIPLGEVEESWFIENLANRQNFYDPLKRGLELFGTVILGIVFLPLELLVALAIKLTLRGSVIYKQVRVGRHGKEFTLYKFRTMPLDAEKGGARWSTPGDTRPTAIGKVLRRTHLDELPQLWNIVKGDLSFVGPRPERPEFVKTLKEKIPYYEARLLIKPGVTGWAQIHHGADTSEEDVAEKLQYDLYYIKNRSPILDLAIILKTIKTVFVTPK